MFDLLKFYVWKTSDHDQIYMVYNGSDSIPRDWYKVYKHHKYNIVNDDGVLMWTMRLDENQPINWSLFFDIGDIEIAKYGYARKGIASQVYTKLNELINHKYNLNLRSDWWGISLVASMVWRKLVAEWKAVYLGMNMKGGTHFDGVAGKACPMFEMKRMRID